MLRTRTTVSMWGNNKALRIPDEMSSSLGLRADDEVVLEVRENILTVSKFELTSEDTIEHLFRNYSGESFHTELTNPEVPLGKEQW